MRFELPRDSRHTTVVSTDVASANHHRTWASVIHRAIRQHSQACFYVNYFQCQSSYRLSKHCK